MFRNKEFKILALVSVIALFAEILETIMIVSFGVSWPISIAKSLKSKTSAGKSPLFISMIIFGYICGIISKIIAGNYNLAFYFYWIKYFIRKFYSLEIFIQQRIC